MAKNFGKLFSQKPAQADDLTQIKGIGKRLAEKLNTLGVWTLSQIADWSQENIEAFNTELDFPGRIEREQWVEQAKRMVVRDYGRLYDTRPTHADDLTRINGIGPVIGEKLNKHGVYTFAQIAEWTPANVDTFNNELDFPGRVEREEWIPQAKELMAQDASGTTPREYGLVFDQAPPDADDLTQIKGIGKVLAGKLNEKGIYKFSQIANWTQPNVDAFNEELDFPGRIERENWVPQAKQLQSITRRDPRLGFVYNTRPDHVDDLTQISGVGPVLAGKLNDMGVYTFDQIAGWGSAETEAFGEQLDFQGRVEREEWIAQAQRLLDSGAEATTNATADMGSIADSGDGDASSSSSTDEDGAATSDADGSSKGMIAGAGAAVVAAGAGFAAKFKDDDGSEIESVVESGLTAETPSEAAPLTPPPPSAPPAPLFPPPAAIESVETGPPESPALPEPIGAPGIAAPAAPATPALDGGRTTPPPFRKKPGQTDAPEIPGGIPTASDIPPEAAGLIGGSADETATPAAPILPPPPPPPAAPVTPPEVPQATPAAPPSFFGDPTLPVDASEEPPPRVLIEPPPTPPALPPPPAPTLETPEPFSIPPADDTGLIEPPPLSAEVEAKSDTSKIPLPPVGLQGSDGPKEDTSRIELPPDAVESETKSDTAKVSIPGVAAGIGASVAAGAAAIFGRGSDDEDNAEAAGEGLIPATETPNTGIETPLPPPVPVPEANVPPVLPPPPLPAAPDPVALPIDEDEKIFYSETMPINVDVPEPVAPAASGILPPPPLVPNQDPLPPPVPAGAASENDQFLMSETMPMDIPDPDQLASASDTGRISEIKSDTSKISVPPASTTQIPPINVSDTAQIHAAAGITPPVPATPTGDTTQIPGVVTDTTQIPGGISDTSRIPGTAGDTAQIPAAGLSMAKSDTSKIDLPDLPTGVLPAAAVPPLPEPLPVGKTDTSELSPDDDIFKAQTMELTGLPDDLSGQPQGIVGVTTSRDTGPLPDDPIFKSSTIPVEIPEFEDAPEGSEGIIAIDTPHDELKATTMAIETPEVLGGTKPKLQRPKLSRPSSTKKPLGASGATADATPKTVKLKKAPTATAGGDQPATVKLKKPGAVSGGASAPKTVKLKKSSSAGTPGRPETGSTKKTVKLQRPEAAASGDSSKSKKSKSKTSGGRRRGGRRAAKWSPVWWIVSLLTLIPLILGIIFAFDIRHPKEALVLDVTDMGIPARKPSVPPMPVSFQNTSPLTTEAPDLLPPGGPDETAPVDPLTGEEAPPETPNDGASDLDDMFLDPPE